DGRIIFSPGELHCNDLLHDQELGDTIDTIKMIEGMLNPTQMELFNKRLALFECSVRLRSASSRAKGGRTGSDCAEFRTHALACMWELDHHPPRQNHTFAFLYKPSQRRGRSSTGYAAHVNSLLHRVGECDVDSSSLDTTVTGYSSSSHASAGSDRSSSNSSRSSSSCSSSCSSFTRHSANASRAHVLPVTLTKLSPTLCQGRKDVKPVKVSKYDHLRFIDVLFSLAALD
ncbi:hypothetical protein ADUPG1_004456, partial [Aduncisulcus paluster]